MDKPSQSAWTKTTQSGETKYQNPGRQNIPICRHKRNPERQNITILIDQTSNSGETKHNKSERQHNIIRKHKTSNSHRKKTSQSG